MAVHVGLNASESIEADGNLFGVTLILASSILVKADGAGRCGWRTRRGLCSGKGFRFADRGEFVAEGLKDPVRVYKVCWLG